MFKSNMWTDCDGGILTTELVLVASFVTATLLAGLGALRSQVNSEFQQLSSSIQSANIEQMTNLQAVDTSVVQAQFVPGIELEGFEAWSE